MLANIFNGNRDKNQRVITIQTVSEQYSKESKLLGQLEKFSERHILGESRILGIA